MQGRVHSLGSESMTDVRHVTAEACQARRARHTSNRVRLNACTKRQHTLHAHRGEAEVKICQQDDAKPVAAACSNSYYSS
jgi:hypothetical protein